MRRYLGLVACVLLAACGASADADQETREEPETARIELTAYDFGYEVKTERVPAGPVETVLVNEGEQPHQALLYRLNDGVDFATFKKKVMADNSVIPDLAEAGMDGVPALAASGEEESGIGDNLEPGDYAILCFVLDQSLKTDKNHSELGMIAPLTVE